MIRSKVFFVLIPLVFLAAGCNKKTPEAQNLFGTGTTTIAGHTLNVQIAQTSQAHEKGLGGRHSLAENDGMLFLFSNPSRFAFWMKDTRIPLDFIWIRDGKVVEITKNILPEPNVPDASLRYYLPADLIDSMIEVNAGWTDKNNIKAGDLVIVDVNQ